jgi:hypothetical protein
MLYRIIVRDADDPCVVYVGETRCARYQVNQEACVDLGKSWSYAEQWIFVTGRVVWRDERRVDASFP